MKKRKSTLKWQNAIEYVVFYSIILCSSLGTLVFSNAYADEAEATIEGLMAKKLKQEQEQRDRDAKAEAEAQKKAAEAAKKKAAEKRERDKAKAAAKAKAEADAKKKADAAAKAKIEVEARAKAEDEQRKKDEFIRQISPEMVPIKQGCFQMGQSTAEKQWLIETAGQKDYDKFYADERQHKVCVEPDFEMAKYEVTVGQFRRFVEATGYRTDAEKNVVTEGCLSWTGKDFDWVGGRSWRDPGFLQSEQHPVVCVSWNDARAYVGWLGEQTGRDYRLPTEAEWEYAARALTETVRYWGDDPANQAACRYENVADATSVAKYSWASSFSCNDGYAETSPVGRFSANTYGLHDMLGNASEWTCSAYTDAYNGSERQCSGGGGSPVVRGGAWGDEPGFVRAASRLWFYPAYLNFNIGFRVARTP